MVSFHILMIQVLPTENHEATSKGSDRIDAREQDHFGNLRAPLVIHALGELLKGDPGETDVSCENVRIESDQMFGEVNEE